jgi:ribosomal protein L15E
MNSASSFAEAGIRERWWGRRFEASSLAHERPSPCRVIFYKDPHAEQGALVANKRLSAVLTRIQADQQERDRQRLASPNLTLRQKDRIRAAQERAEESHPLLSGSSVPPTGQLSFAERRTFLTGGDIEIPRFFRLSARTPSL